MPQSLSAYFGRWLVPMFLCSVDIDMTGNVNAFAVQAVAVYVCVCVGVSLLSSALVLCTLAFMF